MESRRWGLVLRMETLAGDAESIEATAGSRAGPRGVGAGCRDGEAAATVLGAVEVRVVHHFKGVTDWTFDLVTYRVPVIWLKILCLLSRLGVHDGTAAQSKQWEMGSRAGG